MTTPDAPKIEFPCDYSLRIVGDAGADFHQVVIDIVRRHAGEIDETRIELNQSRNGNFVSLRITIVATGPEQLQALFAELRGTGRVHTVI